MYDFIVNLFCPTSYLSLILARFWLLCVMWGFWGDFFPNFLPNLVRDMNDMASSHPPAPIRQLPTREGKADLIFSNFCLCNVRGPLRSLATFNNATSFCHACAIVSEITYARLFYIDYLPVNIVLKISVWFNYTDCIMTNQVSIAVDTFTVLLWK